MSYPRQLTTHQARALRIAYMELPVCKTSGRRKGVKALREQFKVVNATIQKLIRRESYQEVV